LSGRIVVDGFDANPPTKRRLVIDGPIGNALMLSGFCGPGFFRASGLPNVVVPAAAATATDLQQGFFQGSRGYRESARDPANCPANASVTAYVHRNRIEFTSDEYSAKGGYV